MRKVIQSLIGGIAPQALVWLPVLGAAVFLTLWIVAESGGAALPQKVVLFAALAVAIGLSGWKPVVSLGIVAATPVLQFAGVLYPPSSTTWPIYFSVVIVAVVAGFGARGIAARVALPTLLVAAVLIPVRMMVPSAEEGYWTSWTGGAYRSFPRFDPVHPLREDLVVLIVLAVISFVGAWAIGIAGRSLVSERIMGGILVSAKSQLKEADFELRLSQDRARISRDVHDALAHSLAVIVSQAEGALALQRKRPQVAGESLQNIATVGRAALLDVRSLVESIHDEDPAGSRPTIADLAALVTDLRDIGVDASLRTLGTPVPLTPTHEIAVFRIVQESLTNSLKHAGTGGTVRATLDWQGTGLAVLVVSRGTKPTADELPEDGRGVGVRGMRERARLTGGWLTAQPSGDGSFIVTAFIPTPAAVEPHTLVDA